MNVDYQVVIGKDGEPKSALIDWEDFQKICTLLPDGSFAQEFPSEVNNVEEEVELSPPAQYIAGGDYKPLSKIGVDLPENIKRRTEALDQPVIPQNSEEEQTIKLGKRIR